MATLTRTRPTVNGGLRVRADVALLAAAVVYAATAIFDIIGNPAGGEAKLAGANDYIFTALLAPFALATLVAITGLRRLHDGLDGRLGRAGALIVSVAMAVFTADSVITLVVGDPHKTGPSYPLAMLASLLGLLFLTAASWRAAVLPRWVMPAIVLGWFFGGPIGEGGGPVGFRGAALMLAAVFVAASIPVRRIAESRDDALGGGTAALRG